MASFGIIYSLEKPVLKNVYFYNIKSRLQIKIKDSRTTATQFNPTSKKKRPAQRFTTTQSIVLKSTQTNLQKKKEEGVAHNPPYKNDKKQHKNSIHKHATNCDLAGKTKQNKTEANIKCVCNIYCAKGGDLTKSQLELFRFFFFFMFVFSLNKSKLIFFETNTQKKKKKKNEQMGMCIIHNIRLWQDDDGTFKAYDASVSVAIENAKAGSRISLNATYDIVKSDNSSGVQVNVKTNKQRQVRRHRGDPSNDNDASSDSADLFAKLFLLTLLMQLQETENQMNEAQSQMNTGYAIWVCLFVCCFFFILFFFKDFSFLGHWLYDK
ncbi:hypothetical protein RFI_00402 [Reticulomyxa filosa]|uniref:WWE domain-containing protein n=1 Tax=Reticulomyxa filosa TaxID=46433 RepID=X6PG34_RETFI|nr:hypothetical protein RFI_00402 [Reticulomyxa filosa]|eukprot:ETO36657.1 hypothetical protein RFI_00402 [Reticulomyxa filosa]